MSEFRSILTNKQFQSVAVSHFNSTFSVNLLVPILPVFLAQKGFAELEIGLIIGATALSSLLVRPWVGVQVDTRGSRPVIMLGQLLIMASIIALLWAEGILAFIGLRLLFGLALAFYFTSAITFASSIGTGQTNANSIALYTLTTMIGLGLSTSLAQSIFDNYGFEAIVAITSVLLATAFCIIRFRSKPYALPKSKDGKVHFLDVLKTKAVIATSVGQFGSQFALGALFTYLPLAALQSDVPFYSVFFISFAVSVVGSRFFVQSIVIRLGMERACLYAYSSMLLGVTLLVFSLSPAVLVATGLLFGAGFGITFPAFILLLVSRIDAATRGTSLGILTAAGDTATALSAAILGGVMQHFGSFHMFLTVIVILALCMAVLYALIANRAAPLPRQ
jgi:MFS family permease